MVVRSHSRRPSCPRCFAQRSDWGNPCGANPVLANFFIPTLVIWHVVGHIPLPETIGCISNIGIGGRRRRLVGDIGLGITVFCVGVEHWGWIRPDVGVPGTSCRDIGFLNGVLIAGR